MERDGGSRVGICTSLAHRGWFSGNSSTLGCYIATTSRIARSPGHQSDLWYCLGISVGPSTLIQGRMDPPSQECFPLNENNINLKNYTPAGSIGHHSSIVLHRVRARSTPLYSLPLP